MVLRKIVKIDKEKCTGCGLCVPACAEGALGIVDGKVKLVSEVYCDGLGACIGECPQGAITVETREAAEFDEEAVEKNLQSRQLVPTAHHSHIEHQSCPSTRAVRLERDSVKKEIAHIPARRISKLSHWPVQLALVPPDAPFFENADLLIAADCVPFAYANFHSDFLKGKTIVIGCPKLDDSAFYKEKLTKLFTQSNIRSVTVVNMEVPCCFGLFHLVKEALGSSGRMLPLKQEIISMKGDKIPDSKHKHQS